MAHSYIGFVGDKQRKVQKIVHECTGIMRYVDYQLNHHKSDIRKYIIDWFGTPYDDLGQVPGIITKMSNALYSSSIRFTYNDLGDCDGNTFAAALAGDTPESYHGISTETFEMTICPEMFDLKIYKEVGDADTQTQTFLHELSHLVGGTDDELHPDPLKAAAGKEAYGRVAAKRLAEINSKSARNNADNYGFFCKDLAARMRWSQY